MSTLLLWLLACPAEDDKAPFSGDTDSTTDSPTAPDDSGTSGECAPVDICANEIDDDCDGQVDEGGVCFRVDHRGRE